jgi:DnaJ-class molecular chaperone
MNQMRKVRCWRCDGEGDLTDDDGRPRFCPSCMGLGYTSESSPMPSEREDSWYEDPQPVRLTDAD